MKIKRKNSIERFCGSTLFQMAERVGFEPTIELPLYSISNAAPSTTRPSLRVIITLI